MKEISIISFIRTGGVYGPMKKGDKKTLIKCESFLPFFHYIRALPAALTATRLLLLVGPQRSHETPRLFRPFYALELHAARRLGRLRRAEKTLSS